MNRSHALRYVALLLAILVAMGGFSIAVQSVSAAARNPAAEPLEGQVMARLEAVAAGGQGPAAPLVSVAVAGDAVTVVLRLDTPDAIGSALTAEERTTAVLQALLGLPVSEVHVLAIDPRNPGAPPRPLHAFEPLRPREGKPVPAPASAARAAPTEPSSLSGKAVYVSAGHGWYYHPTLGWTTQRGPTNGLIEDFSNAEAVNQYLLAYLRNAGADVFPVRDPAMTPDEIVVDNDTGAYQESGAWATGVLTGYQGGSYRYALSVAPGAPASTAAWSAPISASGWYPVYAWYVPGTNRVSQARFQIAHAGGVSEAAIDQRVHGLTWRYLGAYYFQAGQTACVTLTNASTAAGLAVVADAIRLGGGLGSVSRGGGTSGKPRWEEAARYWAALQNAPLGVVDAYTTGTDANDDVVARPRYADWENEGTGDDAVYVSWHTNASGNGQARGTVSFVYNNDPNPPYDQWTRVPGSLELQEAVHTRVIQAIRGGWDAGWVDFGRWRANLGEVREARSMPSMLIEMAFHDNVTDAAQLREPRFQQLLARAVYQGIVDYHARKEGRAMVYLPEPPQALTLRNTGAGGALLAWEPPPAFAFGTPAGAAERYRVYLSADGFAWDDGREALSPTLALTGFQAGQVVYARVTALNAGGESLPTPVLAVRIGDAPRVLVVHGFDSLDASLRIPGNGATRMIVSRMNRLNYLVEHAGALNEAFDSAQREAVASGAVALAAYRLVDWQAGQQSAADGVLNAAERAALRAFLAEPGRVWLLSGANAAAALAQADPDFLAQVLGAALVADESSRRDVCVAEPGLFNALALFELDDGTGDAYAARSLDALSAEPGAEPALAYGAAAAAGVRHRLPSGAQAVLLSFPFETMRPAAARQALMGRVTALLDPPPPPPWPLRAYLPLALGGETSVAWRCPTSSSAVALGIGDSSGASQASAAPPSNRSKPGRLN
jgi:N-acetylmuramoyl-L-alanine amidase